jgi:hypothetical protein
MFLRNIWHSPSYIASQPKKDSTLHTALFFTIINLYMQLQEAFDTEAPLTFLSLSLTHIHTRARARTHTVCMETFRGKWGFVIICYYYFQGF